MMLADLRQPLFQYWHATGRWKEVPLDSFDSGAAPEPEPQEVTNPEPYTSYPPHDGDDDELYGDLAKLCRAPACRKRLTGKQDSFCSKTCGDRVWKRESRRRKGQLSQWRQVIDTLSEGDWLLVQSVSDLESYREALVN